MVKETITKSAHTFSCLIILATYVCVFMFKPIMSVEMYSKSFS